MNKKIYFFLLLSFLLGALPVWAKGSVNLKAGNYFVRDIDITLQANPYLQVERTYSSTNKKIGWFGVGWSSFYETSIHKTKTDKRLYLLEYGVLPKIMFVKKDPKSQKYYSHRGEVMTKTAKGYTRHTAEDTTEFYNDHGQLTQVQYTSDHYLKLIYKKKKLKTIQDHQGGQLHFSWTADGRVEKVIGTNKKETRYYYDNPFLKKVLGKETEEYSYDDRANLIQVTKGSKKTTIQYDSKTHHVSEVIRANGDQARYQYLYDPKKHNLSYKVIVNEVRDKKKHKSEFHYENKERSDGSQYTASLKVIDGHSEATSFYSPSCQLPIKVIDGKKTYQFKYNKKCLLVEKKTNSGDKLIISYTDKDKMAEVVHNKLWTRYQYNDKGRVKLVEDAKGRKIKLTYDHLDRVKFLENQEKKEVSADKFQFNYAGRGTDNFELKINNKKRVQVKILPSGEFLMGRKADKKTQERILKVFQVMNTMMNAHKISL